MESIQQQTFIEMMEALNRRMDQFEGELQKTPPSSNTTSSLAAEFAAFKVFTAEIFRGFQQLGILAQNIDNLEMNSRRKILLFHGVKEEEKQDLAALVVNIVCNQFKLPHFAVSSISRCQRMGRTTSDKPRPILVKLKNFDERNKIWLTKSSLKGTSITLSEFLTRPRHQAFMEARQRFGINKCWTRDGFVHIIGPDGKRHRISSVCELLKIAPEVSNPLPATAPKEVGAASKSRRAASRK